ncbi:MAG: MarR family transcriptional regulator [Lysobacterales bacterium]|jgi:DNA-binding MarR family transcriptional regulator
MNLKADSIGFLLADVTRLMRRAFQHHLEGSSLTLAQARALIYVARNEGLHQVELADLLEIKPITVARLIDKLAALGMVERRQDPDDRRAYHVFLAPGAEADIRAIEKVGDHIRAKAVKGLSRQQAEQLSDVLCKMRDNLSAL